MFINSLAKCSFSHLFHYSFQQKQSASESLDKIVSGYQVVFGSEVDEDVVLSRCSNSISYLEKLDKQIGADVNSGTLACTLLIILAYSFLIIFTAYSVLYDFSPVIRSEVQELINLRCNVFIFSPPPPPDIRPPQTQIAKKEKRFLEERKKKKCF